MLNDGFEERTKACKKLEAAESKLLRTATLTWRKRLKEHEKAAKRARPKDEEKGDSGDSEPLVIPDKPSHQFLNELVSNEKRPKHRLGFMGLFGQKVDTIDWCKVSA